MAEDLEQNTETSSASPTQDELDAKKEELGPYNKIDKFNEMYYEIKEGKRQLAKRDEALDKRNKETAEMKDLFFSLDERMDNLIPAPDPEVDPEGFKKYITDNATRKVQREARKTVTVEPTPKPKTEKTPEQVRIDLLEDVERELRRDAKISFDDVAQVAIKSMKNNPVLAETLYGKHNPVKAIYEHGMKLINADAEMKADLLARGSLEGGDGGNELPEKNSGKYSYNGKIMNDNQLTAWKRANLDMDKLTLIK